jgi:hypothetical protein
MKPAHRLLAQSVAGTSELSEAPNGPTRTQNGWLFFGASIRHRMSVLF